MSIITVLLMDCSGVYGETAILRFSISLYLVICVCHSLYVMVFEIPVYGDLRNMLYVQ